MDTRRLVQAVLVVALLGGGLTAAYLGLSRSPQPSEPVAVAPAPVTAVSEPEPLIVEEAPPRSSLPLPDAPDLSFGQIMRILGAESDKPEVAQAAGEFKKEFVETPELKKAFDEYRHRAARGLDPPAAEFLQTLRAIPAFRKLMAKWGSGTGKSAMLILAKHPEIRRFLNEERRAAAAAGPVAGRSPVSSVGTIRSARGVLPRGGTRNFGAGPAASAALASAGPSDIGTGAAAIGSGAANAERTSAAQASGRASGGGTAPLAKLSDACSQQMDHLLKEWLARHGLSAEAYMSDRSSGIWDLCFKRGELERCDRACRDQPRAPESRSDSGCGSVGHTRISAVCAAPSDPTYWGTCLEAHGEELRCVRGCNEQAPCRIPAEVWNRLCVPQGAFAPPAECRANGGRAAPEGAEPACRGEGCTPEGIRCWSQGIGLPDCVGRQFCGEHGHLPRSLPELVDWGNDTGRRNPATQVWTCR
ncbi:MAG: hypothetical protein HY553_18440 [Elusimicrobia bacterium]|nr:hypothetical protein [Elusimicrobiota bacterium]